VAVRALVITGSMGSGKTTILGEASDLLAAAGIPHGTIDLDAIGAVGLREEVAEDLEQFVARAGELDRIVARAALEDFVIANDGRAVTDVARVLLKRAGWLE